MTGENLKGKGMTIAVKGSVISILDKVNCQIRRPCVEGPSACVNGGRGEKWLQHGDMAAGSVIA